MQKLSARSDAGADAKPEPRWDACDSDFVERGNRAGYACGIAYDRDASGATTSTSSLGASRCGGSAAATSSATSRPIDRSGRHYRDGYSDRTA
ncbi:hypothetical protein [Tunturiibacter gelidiferens]|uniref:Uncharacterized protein n=1 Tax=Tunturiibacter gelidiferens TaxID=3069689 RepID=A0AAU7YXD3_9BACT